MCDYNIKIKTCYTLVYVSWKPILEIYGVYDLKKIKIKVT